MRWRLTILGLLLSWLAMPLPAQQQETVCSLSEEQTEKSIQAFAELVPLFQHPRCINCHGEVNPFDPDDGGHEGESFPPEDRDAKDENGNPKADCSKGGCHTELKGWRLAPEGMSFIDGPDQPKDAEHLCELMHRSFRYAKETQGEESFMGHMIRDNGAPAFIETALIGKRAMTDKTLAPDKAEPPPGWDHPRVIQAGQRWIDAMGGRFHGNTWCGCKKQEYVFHLDYEQTLNVNFGVINGQDKKTTGSPSSPGIDIPLKAVEPKVFKGDGFITLGDRGQYGTVIGNCAGQGHQGFNVTVTARIEEGKEEERGNDDKMHVTFECKRIKEQFSGECAGHGGASKATQECDVSGVKLDFKPPIVGHPESQEFPTPLPNSTSKMTGTILKKE